MTIDLQRMLATFHDEAAELLAQMESLLLAAEQTPPDDDALHALFRCAHTIKGSGGMFGYAGLVEYTHHVETLLDHLRHHDLAWQPRWVGVLLRARDRMAALLVSGTDSRAAPDWLSELELSGAEPPAMPAARAEVGPAITSSGGGPLGADHWHMSLRFAPGLFKLGMEPLNFIRYLEQYGRIVHIEAVRDHLPEWSDYDPEQCYLGFEIALASDASRDDLLGVFDFMWDDARILLLPPHSRLEEYVQLLEQLPEDTRRLGDMLVACGTLTARELADALERQASGGEPQKLGEILLEQTALAAPVLDAALEHQRQTDERQQREARLVKLPAGRLDGLVDRVGELVIACAGVERLAGQILQPALQEAVTDLTRQMAELRDFALGLRMVPVDTVFGRFPRVVRDLAQELGKQVELQISGGDTELDKSLVDQIGDPLLHLLRNAIDHGIETPAERRAAGKPEQGAIHLAARHESGSIIIEVRDDGRGLDPQRIAAKARSQGLLGEHEQLPAQALQQLIFAPGFSTAEQVTNVSGRGVGMDVVNTAVAQLRGRIDLESSVGGGCRFSIALPLTLAIIDGLLVSVNHRHFVIPLDQVVECIEYRADQGELINVRGESMPILPLRRAFDLRGATPARQSAVVVMAGHQRIGLVVDRLQGETQVVIKSLGPMFERLSGIAGSTILGGGTIALILDIPKLVAAAIGRNQADWRAAATLARFQPGISIGRREASP